jgi:hypothetical protein
MDINHYELAELLKDDIYNATTRWYQGVQPGRSGNHSADYLEADVVWLGFGNFEDVTLEWNGGQEFFIVESNCDEMFPGCTISVNEILDIVL